MGLALLIAPPAWGQVGHDGVVETGAAWIYSSKETQGFRYFRAKIELDVDVSDEIELQVDLRGDARDETVELRAVHVDFEYTDAFQVRVGYLKKRFGLEALENRENLPTVERSDVNAFLSTLGYVGRDYGIQVFRRYRGEGRPLSFRTGLAYNDSRTGGAFARFTLHDRPDHRRVGAGVIYQYYRTNKVDSGADHILAAGIDAGFTRGSLDIDAEIVAGRDPVETQLRRFTGDHGPVNFLGARSTLLYRIAVPTRVVRTLEPVLLLGILAPDAGAPEQNRLQALGGLNVYFDEDVRLMINGFGLAARNRFQVDRSYSGSAFRVVLQAQW